MAQDSSHNENALPPMGPDEVCRVMGGQVVYFCPACKAPHSIPFAPPHSYRWEFNGSLTRPTITPSVRTRLGQPNECHHFVRDGHIEFCTDSKHDLAGKTVALEKRCPFRLWEENDTTR